MAHCGVVDGFDPPELWDSSHYGMVHRPHETIAVFSYGFLGF
jgi:hypothetical protein